MVKTSGSVIITFWRWSQSSSLFNSKCKIMAWERRDLRSWLRILVKTKIFKSSSPSQWIKMELLRKMQLRWIEFVSVSGWDRWGMNILLPILLSLPLQQWTTGSANQIVKLRQVKIITLEGFNSYRSPFHQCSGGDYKEISCPPKGVDEWRGTGEETDDNKLVWTGEEGQKTGHYGLTSLIYFIKS